MSTEQDAPNVSALASICAVLFISIAGIAAAVTALVRNAQDEQHQQKSAPALKPVEDMITQQNADLRAGPKRDGDKVVVPIDRAMAIVLKNLKDDPQSATPPAPLDAGVDAATQTDEGGTDELAADGGAADEDAGAAALDAGAAPPTGEEQPAPAAPDAGAPKPKKPPKPPGQPKPPAPPPEGEPTEP